MTTRRHLLTAAIGLLAIRVLPAAAAPTALPEVQVYRNPGCGCCGAWIDHLKSAGFPVKVLMVDDPGSVRRRVGMPDAMASCHTALVDGYVLEGHVPAADVRRLLAAKPAALGLAVPGMPEGSPGMETGGRDAYDVLLVDADGRTTVYAHHAGR